jgi:hypothetical protein
VPHLPSSFLSPRQFVGEVRIFSPQGEKFPRGPRSSLSDSAIYQQLKTEGWPNSRIASPGLPDRQSCA